MHIISCFHLRNHSVAPEHNHYSIVTLHRVCSKYIIQPHEYTIIIYTHTQTLHTHLLDVGLVALVLGGPEAGVPAEEVAGEDWRLKPLLHLQPTQPRGKIKCKEKVRK